MRPTSVVLPAPFGPISARTSPRSRRRSTPLTASRPPKRFEIPRVSSSGVTEATPPTAPGCRPRCRAGAHRVMTTRRGAHDQEVGGREAARDVHHVGHHERAHQRAQHGPGAAQKRPQQRVDRVEDAGERRADVGEQQRVRGTRDARQEPGHDHREEPVPVSVVAEQSRALLVLTHRHQHAPDRRAGEPEARQEARGEDGQRQVVLDASVRPGPGAARRRFTWRPVRMNP